MIIKEEMRKRIIRDAVISAVVILAIWFYLADRSGQLWFMLRNVGSNFD